MHASLRMYCVYRRIFDLIASASERSCRVGLFGLIWVRLWSPTQPCTSHDEQLYRLQVHERALIPLLVVNFAEKRVRRHASDRRLDRMPRMRMCMHFGMHHAPGMHFDAHSFTFMRHGTRRGPQHRVLRTADLGGSQKAMLEPLGSCRGACVSCMHHSSCHDRCACSMACRARAYGPRARSVSAPSPAWQRPARRHRSRLGTLAHMHSFPHAVE